MVPEDAKAVQERAVAYWCTLRPQNEFHSWLVDQIAVLSLRIDRCERIERRVRDKVALRAELTWDEDRAREVEELGGRIGRRPGEVVAALKEIPQGCEWLMGRWSMLAHAADLSGSWTAEQTRLAFDLLGTAPEFREGRRPGMALDLDGKVVEPAEDPSALARREIARLEGRRALVAELDEVERALASTDLGGEPGLELRRLRRYEGGLHRRLRWCMAQLQTPSPHKTPNPDLKPRWVTPTEPATEAPGPSKPESPTPAASRRPEPWEVAPPNPPFDLEADEVPETPGPVDVPAIEASRRVRRAARAEARRQSRRRKVERIRGASEPIRGAERTHSRGESA